MNLNTFNNFLYQFHKKKFFYLLLFIINFFFLSEYIILGKFSYVRIFDNLDSFLPRYFDFVKNNFSLWSPSILNGIPSNVYNHRLFYLPSYLFYFFDYKYTVFIIFFVSNLISAFFIIRIFNKTNISYFLIFVGIIFSWSVSLQENLSWYILALNFIPCIIFFLLIANESQLLSKLFYIFISSIVFILTNHFLLTFVYVYTLVLFLYFLFIYIMNKNSYSLRSVFFTFFIFSFFVLSFNFFNLLNFTSYAELTTRINQEYYNYGIFGSLKLFQKYFDIYYPIFFLILLSIFISKENKIVLIALFIFMSLIFISQFYGSFIPLIKLYLGKLSNFPLQRYSMLLPVLSIFLIPLALNSIEKNIFIYNNTSYKISSFISAILLIYILNNHFFLKINNIYQWYNYGNYGWIHSSDWEVLELNKDLSRVFVITDHSKKFIPGFAQLKGFETIGGDETATNSFIDFWSVINTYKKTPTNHSYYTGYKEKNLFLDNYVDDLIDIKLIQYSNVKYIISAFKLNIKNQNLLRLVNQKKIKTTFNNKKINHVFNGSKIYIYKLSDFKPRAFFSNNVLFSNYSEFKTDLPKIKYLKNQILINKKNKNYLNDFLLNSKHCHNLPIPDIKFYSADRIIINTKLDQNCLMTVSNSYHPSWRFEINGKTSKYFKANINHMVVPVPKGDNEIIIFFTG
jgi:hypothetical protein